MTFEEWLATTNYEDNPNMAQLLFECWETAIDYQLNKTQENKCILDPNTALSKEQLLKLCLQKRKIKDQVDNNLLRYINFEMEASANEGNFGVKIENDQNEEVLTENQVKIIADIYTSLGYECHIGLANKFSLNNVYIYWSSPELTIKK